MANKEFQVRHGIRVDNTLVIDSSGEWQGNPVPVIWGQVNGTLSNQTDLQNAIDCKSARGHSHTGSTISSLDAGDTTTGTFADARISVGSITQQLHSIDLAVTM